jgi:hypothetical protein
MKHHLTLACLLIASEWRPLDAQQNSAAFAHWDAETTAVAAPQGDYRYEGLIFGGVALGAAGAWIGSQISQGCILPAEPGGGGCGSDRLGNAVATGLAGAAIGAGLGYLIGRFSPKRPRPSVIPSMPSPSLTSMPDSVRRRAGYQHWKGAAIGAGVGALLGTSLALGLDGCSDCTTTTWDRAQAVMLITGIGGATGFLAGLASPKYVWERTEP